MLYFLYMNNIKFHEVTWYSKLAAIIFFIGVLPVIAFCIGKQYGEVTALADTPIYVAPAPVVTAPASVTNSIFLKYFMAVTPVNQGLGSSSNIVGYFAGGNFFFYVPQWIPDHWTMTNVGAGMKFSIKDKIKTDFSDITIAVATTTENHNAETLYTKEIPSSDKALCITGSRCEIKDPNSPIITAEILLSTVGDTRIYHVVDERPDGTIRDRYFIDGRNMTATITFSAEKEGYSLYAPKVKEFVQGIGKGESPRG